MKQQRTQGVLGISLAAILVSASLAWGELDVGDFTLRGSAGVGGLPQSFVGSRNKFEEYRDVPESVVVPEIELKLDSKKNNYFFEFDSTHVGRDDQNYRLRLGEHGLWNLQFEWDQLPHLFNSETAATPFSRSNGNYTLSSKPTVINSLDCVTVGHTCQWVNNNSQREVLKMIHGFARLNLRVTPTPNWTFTGGYSSQNVNGDRAFATVIDRFSNIVELAEPIDYQTHNVELGGEYAASWWSLGLKYNLSLFHNGNSTMVWENPFNLSGLGPHGGPGGCVDTASAPCQGRLDLYPSNQAHTFTLTGTASLPWKTTVLGTMSYGWRLQDDSFLPFALNTAIAQPVLTRNSLDGDVRPTMINFTVVNRYVDRLNLKAFYRFYDYDNRSKKVFFPDGYVHTDSDPATDPIRSFPWSYSKHTLGLEPSYKFTNWLTGKLAYGFERMHREQREVLNADEHSLGPTFDIQPNSWVLIRAGYKRWWRSAPDYDAGRYHVVRVGVEPEEIRMESLEALRKFDEAKRTRDKISLFTQVSPFEILTLHGGLDFTLDKYPDSVVGLQNDINYSPSVGFVYMPADWVRVFGDYNYDRFKWKLRAMERSAQGGATGCPARDLQTPENCPSSLWTSRGDEMVHSFSLGMDTALIKDVLDLRFQYGYSQGKSEVRASGNTTPGNVPATDYPTILNRWHEFLVRLEYAVHKNVALQVGYYFNKYNTKDQGVDVMKLWMGDVDSGARNSIFLGDRLKGNYTAHVGFVGMKFKF